MITLTKEKSLINNACIRLDTVATENLSNLSVVYTSTEM